MSTFFSIYTEAWYDTCSQQFMNVLSTDRVPPGALGLHVRRLQSSSSSSIRPYSSSVFNGVINTCCPRFGIIDFLCARRTRSEFMNPVQLSELCMFLINTGQYMVNSEITKAFQQAHVEAGSRRILMVVEYRS